jgi:hypothetical protein
LNMFSDLFEDTKPQEIEIPPNGASLDLLQAVYRRSDLPLTTRMRAAIAALNYELPRLAVTAQISESDFATVLDKTIPELAFNADARLVSCNDNRALQNQRLLHRFSPQMSHVVLYDRMVHRATKTPEPLKRIV